MVGAGGDAAAAADEYARLHADARRRFGVADPRAAELGRTLGLRLVALGRHGEAVEALEAAAESGLPLDIEARRALIVSLMESHRVKASIAQASQLVADLESSRGAGDRDRWLASLLLAQHLFRGGWVRDAVARLDDVLARPGFDDQLTVEARRVRGLALAEAGRHAESFDAILAVLPELRRVHGGDHEYTVTARWTAADDLCRLRRWPELVDLIANDLESFARVFGDADARTFKARLMFARGLGESGHRIRAGDVLRGLISDLRAVEGRRGSRVREAQHWRKRYFTAFDVLRIVGVVLWVIVKYTAIGLYYFMYGIVQLIEDAARWYRS